MRFGLLAPASRDRIAGYVYGTIVTLAAVTAGASAYGSELWKLVAIVALSVLVLWIAHVYSHGLGESLALERRLSGGELAAIAGRELAIAYAAVLPLLAIVLGALGLLDEDAAVWLAMGVGVAGLVAQGARYARLERLGATGTAVSIAVNVGLGLLIVAAKVVVAH